MNSPFSYLFKNSPQKAISLPPLFQCTHATQQKLVPAASSSPFCSTPTFTQLSKPSNRSKKPTILPSLFKIRCLPTANWGKHHRCACRRSNRFDFPFSEEQPSSWCASRAKGRHVNPRRDVTCTTATTKKRRREKLQQEQRQRQQRRTARFATWTCLLSSGWMG